MSFLSHFGIVHIDGTLGLRNAKHFEPLMVIVRPGVARADGCHTHCGLRRIQLHVQRIDTKQQARISMP